MKIYLEQTHHTIGDMDSIFRSIQSVFEGESEGVHIFPELFLTGYPLQDLCLEKNFILNYLSFCERIDEFLKQLPPSGTACLVGGLDYEFQENHLPRRITNCVFELRPGHGMKNIYSKRLLPNYDIFDEGKYFTPGTETCIWEFGGETFGILVCEDMWPSSSYDSDPARDLLAFTDDKSKTLSGVINLSASPFRRGMQENRIRRATEISKALGAPFYYVNRVGGEDEVLFDGASFAVCNDKVLKQAKRFEADSLSFELAHYNGETVPFATDKSKSSWESLFSPQYNNANPPQMRDLNDDECQELLDAMGFGVQEYARKTGHQSFSVALSGGVDSALVVAIMKIYLRDKQKLEAVYMPSRFSAGLSLELAQTQCETLNIPFSVFPIENIHKLVSDEYREIFKSELDGLGGENIQARIRGALIYARSNASGSLVINTSNKSELAVGYSTLYGDSVGALSLIGDLYKTEVFQICRYINKKYKGLIPEGVISRPPSAELREDQEDSQSLPPYERLDAILEGLICCVHTKGELIELGFDSTEVEKAFKLYTRAEYKRRQFAPIIKLKPKSFGFGHRMPICKIL